MTDIMAKTQAVLPLSEVITSARELATAGRWQSATRLLKATTAVDTQARALIALAVAEVAVEGDWFCGTKAATGALRTAEEMCADLADSSRWDLAFLRVRHDYFGQILSEGRLQLGPDGKEPSVRRRADDLLRDAPDDVRRGWAAMYLGLITENMFGEREAAAAHYEAALRAGESGDDGLLAREALRHLGDHEPRVPGHWLPGRHRPDRGTLQRCPHRNVSTAET